MNWNVRLCDWITSIFCRRINEPDPPPPCPDFLDPDEDWAEWAKYISKPHVTESNRQYLEALWTKK